MSMCFSLVWYSIIISYEYYYAEGRHKKKMIREKLYSLKNSFLSFGTLLHLPCNVMV